MGRDGHAQVVEERAKYKINKVRVCSIPKEYSVSVYKCRLDSCFNHKAKSCIRSPSTSLQTS